MDIGVKRNGTFITSRVISYNREHHICNSVGTLELVLEGTYSGNIAPHDSIDIYENGSFQVRYYVSDVSHNIPEGTITLQCQDKSKYIVDYFIPDSYTIDYPSYTRYWIEKFLTEAGISFQFETASQGNLISNYTQLGLTSAYDQIMTLLQMSGWYMYFDGNGKAIIGSLQTDLADSAGSLSKTDIIDIKKIQDDKMLRNRAVVWGEYDPFRGDYAFADVSVNTRWNYDRNDQRAIVISNSNIPDKNSAYGIANQLIKEFARPTIEKHIVARGARNFNLGEALRVDSHVWRGKGLITTFGVSMDRNGLLTNIILDERCPRLFGFFDFGDYVYVATYGEGIWRKHIKFDPTWYNFSTGLTNLNITDLHINNGVFGSVGAAGEMYYANDESGSWHPVTVTGLQSSTEDTASGIITYETFSGIYAHATIVDKSSNNVKFGVDTWSGLNMGDYFMQYSGWTTSMSGISISGGHRGWILEYDPYTGALAGGLGSGIYPISVSGNYNITVIDLENDGYNDYVSVRVGGNGAIPQGLDGYALGKHDTSQTWNTYDSTGLVTLPIFPDGTEIEVQATNGITTQRAGISVKDDGITGEREIVYHDTFLNQLRRKVYSKDVDGEIVTTTTTTSFTTTETILRIYWMSKDNYRIYYASAGTTTTVKYKDWDIASNTLGSEQTAFTHTFDLDTEGGSVFIRSYISVGDTGYILIRTFRRFVTSAGFNVNPESFRLFLIQIDMKAGSGSMSKIYELITEETSLGSGRYEIIPADSHFDSDDPNNEFFSLFQDGDTGIKIIGWLEYGSGGSDWTELLFNGNSAGVTTQILRNDPTSRFLGSQLTSLDGNDRYTQLTKTMGLIMAEGSGPGSPLGFSTNGHTFTTYVGAAPYYLKPAKIYPIFSSTENKYIARDSGGDYWACDATLIAPLSQITAPGGFELIRPFSNAGSFSNEIMWLVEDTVDFDPWLASAASVQASPSAGRFVLPSLSFSTNKAINVGGWILTAPTTFNTTNPNFLAAYIWYGAGDLPAGSYLVLQRDGETFTIIEEETYPIRIDSSLTAPLLTVGSGDSSFHSNYITANDLTVIQPAGILTAYQVNDYRYTMLEPTVSGVAQSGVAVGSTGLFIYGSGIFGFDTATYSGGFIETFEVPSGFGTRIETSNYGLNGQYIFITASGDTQQFYQKDPTTFGGVFTLYSGLVQSRATIIRTDDRL